MDSIQLIDDSGYERTHQKAAAMAFAVHSSPPQRGFKEFPLCGRCCGCKNSRSGHDTCQPTNKVPTGIVYPIFIKVARCPAVVARGSRDRSCMAEAGDLNEI